MSRRRKGTPTARRIPAAALVSFVSVHRSLKNPSAVIDDPDLVILSRTSRHVANQHDADLSTIHPIPNFRSLAMNLHQGGLAP